MSVKSETIVAPADLLLTRIIDAPRKLVFKAWTDPKQVAKWWGPKGFTNPICDLDVRPGGSIYIQMRAANGVDYPMAGMYREIAEPEKISFISGALNDDGKLIFEVLNTVTFAEHEGKTKLTLESRIVRRSSSADSYLSGMSKGWDQSLCRLSDFVGGV